MPSPPSSCKTFPVEVLALNNPPEVVTDKSKIIYHTILAISRCVTQPNFEKISADDVVLVFNLYERAAPAGGARDGQPDFSKDFSRAGCEIAAGSVF